MPAAAPPNLDAGKDRCLLTAEQTALALGVTRRQLGRFTARREAPLPIFEIGGGRNRPSRFDAAAIVRWAREEERRALNVDAGGLLDLEQSRARLAQAQADAHEMKNAERRQELIPAPVFGEAFSRLAAALRSRVEAWPVRLKNAQPALDAAAIEVVQRETSAVLEEIARLRFDASLQVEASGELDGVEEYGPPASGFVPPPVQSAPGAGASVP